MSDAPSQLSLILSVLNTVGIIVATAITTWRSVSTTNAVALAKRLEDAESDLEALWSELDSERDYSADMAGWGHSVVMIARGQGLTLPEMPKRPPRPTHIRHSKGDKG